MPQPHLTPDQKQVINRTMAGAVRMWDQELIRKCAEAGADTQNLLIQAVSRKNIDMVRVALEYGARIDGQVKTGEGNFHPLLHFAHDNFYEPVLRELLQRGLKIDQQNAVGDTIAQRAARGGDFDRMRLYISMGADLDRSVQEIMVIAVNKRDLPTVKWCVDKGADVNVKVKVRDNQSTTLLHLAMEQLREDMVEYFLGKGLPIDSKNSSGETPLMLAARQSDLKRIEYLLAKGAKALEVNNEGQTALDDAMKACEKAQDNANTSSSSYNGAASITRQNARTIVNVLLENIKAQHGTMHPYSPELRHDVKVMKPITTIPKPPKTE